VAGGESRLYHSFSDLSFIRMILRLSNWSPAAAGLDN